MKIMKPNLLSNIDKIGKSLTFQGFDYLIIYRAIFDWTTAVGCSTGCYCYKS